MLPGFTAIQQGRVEKMSLSGDPSDVKDLAVQPPAVTPPPTGGASTILEIARTSGWRAIDLGEIWAFRGLLHVLVWRDLKVRYRQTLLGAAWVLGQPLLSVLIFTFLFNRIAHIKGPAGIPYPVFVLAGLLPWSFFAGGAQSSGNSLIGSSHLISKVYFPRLIVPGAAVLVGLVDLAVTGLLLGGLMAWYRVAPGPSILALPLIVLLGLTLTLGVGLWLSALNVEYRDVRVLIPFLLQISMYLTPVVYPLDVLPPSVRPWVGLNPMTGVVEGFRACILGTPFPGALVASSSVAAALVLVSGALYFRRVERLFADVL